MNEVLCSVPGWTEPLCLHFFHPWYTGLSVRSGSEAGSGCVRRSADPLQSSFSGRPLGPVQHNSISNSPPTGPSHTLMRSIGREKEEVRKTDNAVCWWGGRHSGLGSC